MQTHLSYIHRTLHLARKGASFAQPNPMVGAIIVHNNKIIGEGYHRKVGEAHAEVNAINAVKNQALLSESTLYVSLEPCSHYGKTPPCTELIISKKIPRVVIATADPNPKVSGKGIRIMRENGIEVITGVLENEARKLNKAFFISQTQRRPYVILKWAQSNDGFIDTHRTSLTEKPPARLSNNLTSVLAHKLRTETQAIMVGTRTALLDNPRLTARKWFGTNPTRIVIDRESKLPHNLAVFDETAPTIVFTDFSSNPLSQKRNVSYVWIDFSQNSVEQILRRLFERNIFSLLVEGGAKTLSTFIEKKLWDEAFVEISNTSLFSGIKAPDIQTERAKIYQYFDSFQIRLESEITRNFT
jgi:diaminohydroxyphosphoribosylaminopyrimidine deaminase/5-amino-6-(5-phosphoribosylamino)uracil reductase